MNRKNYQVYLDPAGLSKVQSEFSLFNEISESKMTREFWDSVLSIVRRIINEKLTIEEKRVIGLLLNGTKFKHVASLLSKCQRTIYYRYHKIVGKISASLAGDGEFLALKVPGDVKGIVNAWVTRRRSSKRIVYGWYGGLMRVGPVRCPVCRKKFDTAVRWKNHLIVEKYNKKDDSAMRKRHLQFIKDQEGMIRKHARAGLPTRRLVEKLMNMKGFYLGRTWIYRFCRPKHFKKPVNSGGRSNYEGIHAKARAGRKAPLRCPEPKL